MPWSHISRGQATAGVVEVQEVGHTHFGKVLRHLQLTIQPYM